MTRRNCWMVAVVSVLMLAFTILILPAPLIPHVILKSEDVPLGSAADYHVCIPRAMARVPGLSAESGRWESDGDYYVPNVYEFGSDKFGIIVRVLSPEVPVVAVKPLPLAGVKIMLPGPSMWNLMPWRAHPSVGPIFDGVVKSITQECS